MSQYSVSARGPRSGEYAERLAFECAEHWRGGRQMCEEVSLRGNRCLNRRHKVSQCQQRKNEDRRHQKLDEET